VLEAADGAGGFEAVHNGHVDVHEDDFWFDGGVVEGAGLGGGLVVVVLVLLLVVFCGLFVDFQGFLAVVRCAIEVAGFLGEDFEEAEVDGLLGRGVSWGIAEDQLFWTERLTLSSTNRRDIVSVLKHGTVFARLICACGGLWAWTGSATSLSLLLTRGVCGGRGSSQLAERIVAPITSLLLGLSSSGTAGVTSASLGE